MSGAIEQSLGPAVELIAEAAFGGGEQEPLVGEARGRIDAEVEPGEVADRLGADADLAIGRDRHRQRIGSARADVADQHRGAAVDEALGQPFVQGVGQPRFDLARALGPFGGVGEPVGPVRHIGPAANPGEPVGERLDVAVHIVEPGHLRGEPFVGDVTAFADIAEDAADHPRVVHRPDLAEIGQAARRPQPPRRGAALGRDGRVFGDQLEHGEVDRQRRRAQQRVVAFLLEAGDEGADIGEIQVRAAPVEVVERPEAMLLDRIDFLVAEAGSVFAAEAERAEAAVALVAAGAAGDLRHFGDASGGGRGARRTFRGRRRRHGRRPC